MSVTNYTPGLSATCRYNYSKLKDVIYLVSKDHLKNVHIDNGEAYIDGLTELPLRLNGFNISLKEESSLDERYAFSKTVTLSMHGYVNSSIFGGRYYVILESYDGTFWMCNVDFPSRLTYTFNLAKDVYQTDFTLASLSNFPTLKLGSEFEAVSPVCLGFNTYGVRSLRLLEKDLCGLDTDSKTVQTYTSKGFQDVEFLGDSCSFQEVFDGEKVTTTISFDIGFDAYKSSWHYSLLEFVQNLYSAIVVPKGNDNTFFAGFNFGLQPSFVVQTQSSEGQSDIITITLIEASSHGSTAAVDWDEEQTTETKWVYVKWVSTIKCYECIGFGRARYLVQQEVTQNGVPTGNYKALEGYESYYQSQGLNVISTFTNEEVFNDPDCGGEQCAVITNLPNIITYTAQTCYTYSYSASCNWNVSGLANYMTVTPSAGAADSEYTLSVCNTKTPTDTETSTFKVTAGNNEKIVNVILVPESGILTPQIAYINCLQQDVYFTFDTTCPITVTSIDQRLTYHINNSQLIVNVPRNYSIESGITWTIGVKDCHDNTGTGIIVQDKTYEKWVDSTAYLCESGNSYVKQARYTGTTSGDTNIPTGEYRKGSLIQSGDTRCGGSYQSRWVTSSAYTCVDGDKWSVEEEEISYNGGQTWTKTGNTRLGQMVESASSFCELVEYKWVLTDRWQCDYTPTVSYKLQTTYDSGGTTVERNVECDSATTLTTGDTKPSGYEYSAMTSAVIGDCVTSIDSSAFNGCSSLTSCTIGSGVTSIGVNAFASCSSLLSIVIPNSVTSIGDYTFGSCSSLTSCIIGSGVTSLGFSTFASCSGLTSIDIPDSVTSISAYAFAFCTSLSSCTIGSGVTSIGMYAFEYCSSLTSCTIGSGITSIGNSAFYNCSGLTSIDIPDSVTSIGNYAFRECTSLASIDIPSGVTNIGSNAFYNCSGLTSITVEATTPPTLTNSSSFNNTTCPIYVPAGSVDTYKSAWSQYADRIQAIA